jgi:Tol biopolymer transport system component
MSLETYVTNGLPHEWPTSWVDDSIRAGAVAYRSYGAWYVAHPISPNYDICDNTYCQAYDPATFPPTKRSKADVAATAGVVLSRDGVNIFYAEYAAESNMADDVDGSGNPLATCGDGNIGEPSQNWPCMRDVIDVGKSLSHTHSRGMCQRGSQRWASGIDHTGLKTDTGAVLTTPRDWRCILDHYYNASSNSITVDPSGTGSPGAGCGLRTAFMQDQPTYGVIAYEAYGTRQGSPQGIRVANAADGTNDQSILTGNAFDPSWEPGGARLAFSNGTGIAVVNADGTGLVQLTSNACGPNPSATCDYAPAWSPFSGRIAFCSYRSGTPQIWMMNSDGTNPYQVSTNLSLSDSGLQNLGNSGYEQIDCNLSWSPDEKTLAFTGAIGQWNTSNIHNVFTLTLSDNTTTQVTYCQNNRPDKSTACQTPAWSPDSSSITISNDDTLYGDNMGGAGIYTMFDRWNGSFVDYQNLNAHEWWPRYSTDGRKIFFTSNMTDGYWRLYSLNPDSTGLTTIIGSGSSPSYQPNMSYSCSICKNFGSL